MEKRRWPYDGGVGIQVQVEGEMETPLKEEAESKKPPTTSCQEGPQKSWGLKGTD